ncbi:tRNA epoxyqueuosine(34) reductase QueG [Shouchella sp. JSM 1781072]|uniref:tRNA epoxyqueuosine(34) reductase QueG n=1 Tax=Bacillaceae TaxID=186817 RepID=UPI000C082927|nr:MULTISPECIES: tRNA epoxyqueuosine(34) reductase QueG [Bacillaceae]UTR07759.1 tRNA epoxyqueuosine(34) reductase QueG [Alkalihalobacillus sp. LMS6]
MNVELLKHKLLEYSKTIGIDKVRITTADPFLSLKDRLITHQEKGYASGFEHPHLEERIDPSLSLKEVRTIISIAVAYPSKLSHSPKSVKGERRGFFSRSSWGIDYHDVLNDRLKKIEDFLMQECGSIETVRMVDTGALSDRAVAERAGIGWSAKNTFIIAPELGSYVFLGNLLTTIPFPVDEPIEDLCGSCQKCIDACPTGALVEPGVLNAQACLSYQTQTKGFMPDEYRSKIGNYLYGWDTCQLVCPYNRDQDHHQHVEMEPDPEKIKPLLIPLLTMSNKAFKKEFGHMAGSWRGKKPIQRNAIIALAHYKEKSALPTLLHLLTEDPRPVIRGTSAWAIGKISESEHEKKALEDAKLNEQDEDVKNEIEKGLAFLKQKGE